MTLCKRKNPFRGIITVSGKGQIVISQDLRQELSTKRGDKLITLRRKGDKGFATLKENAPGKIFEKIANDGFDILFLLNKN